MRVLLVYPRFPQTFWSFDRAVALMGHRVLLPPLGLITVAALLPQSWEFQLVDCNIRSLTEEEWRWGDLVILSAMLVQKRDLADQIALAKGHSCRVAVGGPFATSTPDAPELAQVDFLVLDEGEITLPLLVEALARGDAGGRFTAAGEESAIPLAMVGILQALPNTALWHRLEREQRLLKLDPQVAASLRGRFDAGVQTNLLNFLPSRPMEQIAAEFLDAFDRLYEPATYLARVQRYATRLGRHDNRRRPLLQGVLGHLGHPAAAAGLLTLIWRQGVRRPSRGLFWSCLLDTLRHRPHLLDQVLWMCLLNEHFLEYRTLVREQVQGQLRWSQAHPQALVAA